MADFAEWLCDADLAVLEDPTDYRELWTWSTRNPSSFWAALWDYFDVGPRPDGPVLVGDQMPDYRWFPGTRLNYVDYLFRNSEPDAPAVVSVSEESTETVTLTFRELREQVAAVARSLCDMDIRSGDRVVGYLPNTAEAIVAFLATASLGAVWAVCGPDYSPHAAAARLGQLEPRALITSTRHSFGGRPRDKSSAVTELISLLPTLSGVIIEGGEVDIVASCAVMSWTEAVTSRREEFTPEPVAFDHPLWVVFSSGTTGAPKGLMHGHGGVLLEHLKALGLHFELQTGDRMFWYTSPTWMMWNFQLSSLLLGASVICYDGSPTYPKVDAVWEIASRTRATVLGTSPGYLRACEEAKCEPGREHEIRALRMIGVTGAPFPESSASWLASVVGTHVPAVSIIGGTDVVTAFLGGAPTVAIWPGQISCPWLGVAADSFDTSGQPVRDEVGELVITGPMPSMPVAVWNDADRSRYRDLYFDTFPGIWRHGDWVTFTADQGIQVHGRSDATLNRNGIRIGTADIYSIVENLPGIAEALVIGMERPDGDYWMPMFVVPTPGQKITNQTRELITNQLYAKASARHVPDEIVSAPGIPHTKTGKKLEVPIKQLLLGRITADDLDPASIDDPELIRWYSRFAPGFEEG